MGVYIKGMDMPKAGYIDVRIFPDGIASKAIGEKPYYKEFHAVEVKAPHGDLIDRNKLYEKTAEWEAQALHMVEVTMHDEDATDWKRWSTVLTERSAFKFDVVDAPTIIEAEGKDDG